MIWLIVLATLCVTTVATVYLVRREMDISDTLDRIYEAERKLEKGIAVFKPENRSQSKNFRALVRRGIMKHNPLGGYSLVGSQDRLIDVAGRGGPVGEIREAD